MSSPEKSYIYNAHKTDIHIKGYNLWESKGEERKEKYVGLNQHYMALKPK